MPSEWKFSIFVSIHPIVSIDPILRYLLLRLRFWWRRIASLLIVRGITVTTIIHIIEVILFILKERFKVSGPEDHAHVQLIFVFVFANLYFIKKYKEKKQNYMYNTRKIIHIDKDIISGELCFVIRIALQRPSSGVSKKSKKGDL